METVKKYQLILTYNKVVEWADKKGLNSDTPENWKEARDLMAKELQILTIADQKKFTGNRNIPEAFIFELAPIGKAKFKGDKLPVFWSVNQYFKKGKEYPVYDMEGIFVVGENGDSYKMLPSAWTKIK